MLLDRVLHERAQLVGLDRIKLNADIAPKSFERVSDALVGRVGRSHSLICSDVTAMRSKKISASGASSRSVSSIFSPAFTPDGSKSPA